MSDNINHPDPMTMEGLVAWLEQQHPDNAYNYADPYNCLLCQYFRACGFSIRYMNSSVAVLDDYQRCALPMGFNEISHAEPSYSTFGAALERARNALNAR